MTATNTHPLALFLNFIARHGRTPGRFLSLDIETRAPARAKELLGDPAERVQGKEALHPAYMEIACISLMDVLGRFLLIEGTEQDVLSAFFSILQEDVTLATFNGTHFDLPAIETRARLLGIAIPHIFAASDRWGKRRIPHLDLSDFLTVGSNRMTLDQAAKISGFPGKSEPIGCVVADMLSGEDRARAINYCRADVECVIQVGYSSSLFLEKLGRCETPFLLAGNACAPAPADFSPWHLDVIASIPAALALRAKLEAGNTRALDSLPESCRQFFASAAKGSALNTIFDPSFIEIVSACSASLR